MKRYLLPKNGKFYKANMHMHTNISDGAMSPEEVKKVYMEHGYSIVAYTDHEVLLSHKELSDEKFLAITSFEKSINKQRNVDFCKVKTAHLNFFAKEEDNITCSVMNPDETLWCNAKNYVTDEMKKFNYKSEYTTECLNEIIRKGNEDGFLVTLNHPVWSLQNYDDYKDLKGLWGIEVFNYSAVLEGYPDTVQPLDDLLNLGENVLPLATDDAHSLQDCFGGYIMIKADKLDYKTIMSALERGDFYASDGPEITELYLEDNVLTVNCSAAASVSLRTEKRCNKRIAALKGETLTSAEFDLSGYFAQTESDGAPHYFRVEVKGVDGTTAYSRAFFVDELK